MSGGDVADQGWGTWPESTLKLIRKLLQLAESYIYSKSEPLFIIACAIPNSLYHHNRIVPSSSSSRARDSGRAPCIVFKR